MSFEQKPFLHITFSESVILHIVIMGTSTALDGQSNGWILVLALPPMTLSKTQHSIFCI